MAYNDVAEADAALGHVALWLEKDNAEKLRRLSTASLWLRAGFVLPDAPDADELAAIKEAELVAVQAGLTVELFPAPKPAANQGAMTREKRKIGDLETERTWGLPSGGSRTQRVEIGEVNAILLLADIQQRPTETEIPAAFTV